MQDRPLISFHFQARHVEYKDPIEEEWERFQKEIKEEVTVSSQIIEEDHEEATAERQIEEIDEQLRNWNRFEFFLCVLYILIPLSIIILSDTIFFFPGFLR